MWKGIAKKILYTALSPAFIYNKIKYALQINIVRLCCLCIMQIAMDVRLGQNRMSYLLPAPL